MAKSSMQVIVDNTDINSELEHYAAEFCRMNQEIKTMTEQMEGLKEILKSAAIANGNEITVGEYELKVSNVAGKSGFDLKSAQKVISSDLLSPFYTTGAASQRLNVKRLTSES